MGLPIQQLSARPSHLNSLDFKAPRNTSGAKTHLHSPGNSVRLGMAEKRGKEAERTGGKGMDRSTVRVVMPFFRLRCALAASLFAVSSRWAQPRDWGREREQRGRERRERGGDAGKEGPQSAKFCQSAAWLFGWCKRPVETVSHCKKSTYDNVIWLHVDFYNKTLQAAVTE